MLGLALLLQGKLTSWPTARTFTDLAAQIRTQQPARSDDDVRFFVVIPCPEAIGARDTNQTVNNATIVR